MWQKQSQGEVETASFCLKMPLSDSLRDPRSPRIQGHETVTCETECGPRMRFSSVCFSCLALTLRNHEISRWVQSPPSPSETRSLATLGPHDLLMAIPITGDMDSLVHHHCLPGPTARATCPVPSRLPITAVYLGTEKHISASTQPP